MGHAYGFQSRERDLETGLNYHRNRYYNPSIGRWISEDPIGFAGGDVNLNRFVGNTPTTGKDPAGLADPADIFVDGWWPEELLGQTGRLRGQWTARLELEATKHKGYFYAKPSGISTLLQRLKARTSRLFFEEAPSGGAIADYLPFWDTIRFRKSIANVDPLVAVHETVHALNDIQGNDCQ